MSISRLIKFGFFVTATVVAGPTNILAATTGLRKTQDTKTPISVEISSYPENQIPMTSQVSSNPILPEGCEDFTLIKGNFIKAKTTLLGEAHGEKCRKGRGKCVTALTKAKNKTGNDNIVLLELIPDGKYSACEPKDIATECRGWNRPHKKYIKLLILNENAPWFHDLWKKIHDVDYNLQASKKIIEEQISIYQELLKYSRKKYQHKFFEFKILHPDASIENYYPQEAADVDYRQEKLFVLEEIIKKINKNPKTIRKIFSDKFEKIEKSKLALYNDDNNMIIEPNRYMFSNIKKARNKNKDVYVYAGSAHFIDGLEKRTTRKDLTTELYRELDKFADENPYAVLNCSDSIKPSR